MLSERDVAMLDLAGEFWRHEALREQAMRERFALTPMRFWQQVNRLIDTPEALVAHPTLVNRLRRLRSRRRAG